MNTVEGNKLIMAFDGWKLESRQTFDPKHNTQNPGRNEYHVLCKNGRDVRLEDIEFDIGYHKSWDALMPVVEKIESMKSAQVIIQNDYCEIKPGLFRPLFLIHYLSDKGKLDAVWQCVIQFILWYNKSTQVT